MEVIDSLTLGIMQISFFSLAAASWLWSPPPPPPPPPTSFLDVSSEDLIWATGWLGFLLSLAVTQMPTAMTTATVQMLNNATFCVQYALLGAWSGCSTQAVGVLNATLKIGAEKGSQRAKGLQKVTPFLLVPLGAITYKGPLDLLPLSAVAGRLISFQATDMLTMRLIQLVALLPWLPYAHALGQSSAMLTALLSIVLQLVALVSQHSLAELGGRGAAANTDKKSK